MRSDPRVAVVAFWWGGWPENRPDIGQEYVTRLKMAVEANTTEPHNFFIFTDHNKYFNWPADIPVNSHLMSTRFWEAEWNLKKLSMFSKQAGLWYYDWVVALDLDIVIRGNIDFLLRHRSKELMTCRGAYTEDIGGSIIGFDPHQLWCDDLVDWFDKNEPRITKATKGSERKCYRMALAEKVLPSVKYWQWDYPGKILSYKVDGIKNGAPIVRFHGMPRPHQVKEVWNGKNA
jgi:hypothetical protein